MLSPRCIASLVVAALMAPAGLARADGAVVAVLPLSAGERLAIYSKPVADAIAKRLAATAGIATASLSLSGKVPTTVNLIVDGRIVLVARGTVKLECRVRDPGRGTTVVASRATRARALADIDKLADEMATTLAPALVAALAAQKRLLAAETDPAAAVDSPRGGDSALAVRRHAVAAVDDRRPAMLVFPATGEVDPGDLAASGIVTRAAKWLSESLGFRPVTSAERAAAATLVATLAAAHADYGLMVTVREVRFHWHGKVLSARARVRFAVVDASGKAVFDGTVRTGTLVGSRGDRRAALVHHAAIQAVDIVRPHLVRVLSR